jgi:hypothetical protein
MRRCLRETCCALCQDFGLAVDMSKAVFNVIPDVDDNQIESVACHRCLEYFSIQ